MVYWAHSSVHGHNAWYMGSHFVYMDTLLGTWSYSLLHGQTARYMANCWVHTHTARYMGTLLGPCAHILIHGDTVWSMGTLLDVGCLVIFLLYLVGSAIMVSTVRSAKFCTAVEEDDTQGSPYCGDVAHASVRMMLSVTEDEPSW
jgi:hypothetical protein